MDASKSELPEISPEQQLFKEHVDKFVAQQLRKQKRLDAKRNNRTLQELIGESNVLTTEVVDHFFEEQHELEIPEGALEDVRLVFMEMKHRLNKLPPTKRFFILETMDFFRSKISIGKLVPALLLLKGEDQQKAICEFTRPTFLSLKKNIETLAATDSLFNPETIHLDRGALYNLIADIARILLQLFQKDYLHKFGDITSPVELIMCVLKDSRRKLESGEEKGFSMMIKDDTAIRQVLLQFISTIQSHPALYSYALKRHAFYKRFLVKLALPGRFQEYDALDVSKVLTGCLIANPQLKPDSFLIKALLDPEEFSSPNTLRACSKFVEQLSPSTVYALINEVKTTLQKFSKTSLKGEFALMERFSVKYILKAVWGGFVGLIEKGFSNVPPSLEKMLLQLKTVYGEFKAEEQILQGEQPDPIPDNAKETSFIVKDNQVIAIFKDKYELVETDQSSFRGASEGASQKDFSYNSRLFLQEDITLMRFGFCFERLFQSLKGHEKVQIIHYQDKDRKDECYGAYTSGEYLLAFGLTHVKNQRSTAASRWNLFPYVLLFEESPSKQLDRILSREVTNIQGTKIYNEVGLTQKNRIQFYEFLFCLLHQLPDADWRAKDTQFCLQFLYREINQLVQQGSSLIHLESLPV